MAVETKFSELYASTQPVHEKSAELLAGISAMRKQAEHLKSANQFLAGLARTAARGGANKARVAASAAKAVTPAASASIPKVTPRVTAPAPAPSVPTPQAAPAGAAAAAATKPRPTMAEELAAKGTAAPPAAAVPPAASASIPASGPAAAQSQRGWLDQQIVDRMGPVASNLGSSAKSLGSGALGLLQRNPVAAGLGLGTAGLAGYANTSQLEAPDWGPSLSYDQLRAAQKVDPDMLSVATRALMNPLQSIYSLGGLAGDLDRTKITRTSADGTHSYAPTAYGQALQDNVSKRLTGAATANANNRMDSTQATAERDRLKSLLSQGGRPLTESDQRVLKIKPHTDAGLGPMPLAGGGSSAGGELATFKPAPPRRPTY